MVVYASYSKNAKKAQKNKMWEGTKPASDLLDASGPRPNLSTGIHLTASAKRLGALLSLSIFTFFL